MKSSVLIPSLIVFLLVFLLLVISPYNVIHYFNAEAKVDKILSDSELKMELLEDDSEITNVKYLGSDVYQVKTNNGVYLMEIKTEKSTSNIAVFEHKKYVKQIKN